MDFDPDRAMHAITALSSGAAFPPSEVLDQLKATAAPTRALIETAVRAAGSPEEREICRQHREDPEWSRWLSLDANEYATVLRDDPFFHLPIERALDASGWGEGRIAAIESTDHGHAIDGARRLLADLHEIGAEAAELVRSLPNLRRRIKPPLHVLQVQALLRAEMALGSLTGIRALEIGPGNGELLREFLAMGVDAIGLDLEPTRATGVDVIQGDLLTTSLPGPFRLVLATAVLEPGSSAEQPDRRNLDPRVLDRLFELIEPGGVVVIENLCLPLPFTRRDAEAAGFSVEQQPLPQVNLHFGGRSCTLRRSPRAVPSIC